MIRESEVQTLLDDLDHLLIAIGSGHRPALALIGKLRLDLLDMLAAAAPDKPMTDEDDGWPPFREAVSNGRYTTDLPDPEPLDDGHHRGYRKGVSYEQAMKYACPACGAKQGQPCLQLKRRGGTLVEPFVETKHPHDARKEKARNG